MLRYTREGNLEPLDKFNMEIELKALYDKFNTSVEQLKKLPEKEREEKEKMITEEYHEKIKLVSQKLVKKYQTKGKSKNFKIMTIKQKLAFLKKL